MLDKLIQYIAPHHCYGCGREGHILCDNCKENIVYDTFDQCIVCLKPSVEGVCRDCCATTPYARGWAVGTREGVLLEVIDDYKFMRVRAAYRSLAYLLHKSLPIIPSNTIVVFIPTVSTHIRKRGYDHCYLMAKEFATLRNIHFSPTALRRKSDFQQRGKTKAERVRHAKEMFAAGTLQSIDKPYIIIDDIFTTGATMAAAARVLKKAGVKDITVAVVARQTLDG